jgi:hypothetical protein
LKKNIGAQGIIIFETGELDETLGVAKIATPNPHGKTQDKTQRVARDEFSEIAENNITEALIEVEKKNTEFENKMIMVLAISTILAIAIILMLPLHSAKDVIVFIMVIMLAFIANTVNIVAIAAKKIKE